MASSAWTSAMHTAWDSLSTPVVVIDTEGMIRYANAPARDTVADAKRIAEFAPASASRLSGAATGDPVRVEVARHGQRFTVFASGLVGGDTPLAAVFIHACTYDCDNTEAQQAEIEKLEWAVEEGLADLQWERSDLAQLRRSVEALAYSLGHDLQEPVRDVSTCLHLLGPHVPAEHRSLVVDATEATRRLGRLVSGLLAYSKAARREVRRSSRTTMAEVLDSPLCQMQRQRILDRGGAVEVEGDRVPIGATREGLSVILGEFLMNAVLHGPRPPIVGIRVTTEATGVRVDIWDNGPGYPVDVLAGFARQAAASRGFGLAIVRLTVAQMQGTISLDNKNGASAVLRFPESFSSTPFPEGFQPSDDLPSPDPLRGPGALDPPDDLRSPEALGSADDRRPSFGAQHRASVGADGHGPGRRR